MSKGQLPQAQGADYEAWRISFQSSEQAARAAWTAWQEQVALTSLGRGMVSVCKQDANNYCRILTALGMEEEGDPVVEVERLVATQGHIAEPLVRYCPGCGSVGPVEAKYRDCCPDGIEARMIPQALAQKCHDTFRLAVDGIVSAQTPIGGAG